jgi:nucleoside-diphosphate-sugar epimerase
VRQQEGRQRPQTSEVERLIADNTLARKSLGWTPAVSLDDGLSRTIEWIRENLNEYRTDRYVV